jgi:hypothetical protein
MQVSDFINDHLLYVRPITVLSVAALTVYSFSQTPLFFRYRTVRYIPAHSFRRRRWIRGRLVPGPTTVPPAPPLRPAFHPRRLDGPNAPLHLPAAPTAHSASPVLCYIRHLSPMESWLSKSRWLRYRNWTTRSWRLLVPTLTEGTTDGTAQDDDDERIPIQIVGIQYPPPPPLAGPPPSSLSSKKGPVQWGTDTIQQWSREHRLVDCQLYGRVVPPKDTDPPPRKRPIPHWSPPSSSSTEDEADENARVLAQVWVHGAEDDPPPRRSWWSVCVGAVVGPQDAATLLVRQGQAVVLHDGSSEDGSSLSPRNPNYAAQLTRAEYEAAAARVGIWSSDEYRQERPEVLEELKWPANTWVHRLWRRWTRREDRPP